MPSAVPSKIPFSGVFVSLYKISSSFSPAAFFKPSPIRDIPNKNSATPLNKDKISVNPSILLFSSSSVTISSLIDYISFTHILHSNTSYLKMEEKDQS